MVCISPTTEDLVQICQVINYVLFLTECEWRLSNLYTNFFLVDSITIIWRIFSCMVKSKAFDIFLKRKFKFLISFKVVFAICCYKTYKCKKVNHNSDSFILSQEGGVSTKFWPMVWRNFSPAPMPINISMFSYRNT